MATKETRKPRTITKTRALVYAHYAQKFVKTFGTAEEARKYFQALYTLRELADKYGEIDGIDMDSVHAKLIFE